MWSQQLWSSCSRYSGLPRRSFYTCSSPPAASKMPLCFDRMLRAARALAASLSSSVNISHYTLILLHHVRVATVCLRVLLTHLTLLKDLFQSTKLCSCCSLCLQPFALLALFVGHKWFFSINHYSAFAASLFFSSCFYFSFLPLAAGGGSSCSPLVLRKQRGDLSLYLLCSPQPSCCSVTVKYTSNCVAV